MENKNAEERMTEKLRVGLLLDRYQAPAWTELMLRRIAQSERAEIVLVIVNAAPREQLSFRDRLRSRWRQIPSRLVSRALNRIRLRLMERVSCEHNAFEQVDLRPMLQDVPTIAVTPDRKTYSDYFSDDDIAAIASHRPDVLVRLGFRVLRGAILTVARYGVWSYHHGDYLVNRGGPPGFWEAMESWPATGTVLQILTEDLDGGVILYQSWSQTNSRSLTLNNNARYWTSASFLPRMLERLGTLGEERFFAEVERRNAHPAFYSNRLYTKPGNAKLAALLLGKLAQKLRLRLHLKLWSDQWCLLFARQEEISTSLRRFKAIVPPRDRFWADPNVVYRDGTYYIFLEEFLYGSSKGHIALMTMDDNGNYDMPVTVIDEPHHLSYPFVFEWNGALYMLAEACANRAVPLYRCDEFPRKWVFERNLMENVRAVDPTLFCHDGTWFLFVGLAENPGASLLDELFLYFSDNPVSADWTPHPMNPVVSDVRSARPAGRIFERNGMLFRPSQNCSYRYGYGLNLNRIVKLSKTEYEEVKVSGIEPNWHPGVSGVHTLSHAHHLTVVDADVKRARYW
jgi:hypothetical protein